MAFIFVFVTLIGELEREAKATHEGVTVIAATTHVGVLNAVHELQLVAVQVIVETEVGRDVGVAALIVASGKALVARRHPEVIRVFAGGDLKAADELKSIRDEVGWNDGNAKDIELIDICGTTISLNTASEAKSIEQLGCQTVTTMVDVIGERNGVSK